MLFTSLSSAGRYQQTLMKNRAVFAILNRGFSTDQPPAKLVKQLRDMTGSPLKDCLKALSETSGDLEKAKELLRKRGLADAEKRTGRATAEGYVGMRLDKAAKLVTMIEMTCETDFVAKTDKFIQGVEMVLDTLHHHGRTLQIGQQQIADADYLAKLCKEIKLNKSLDADIGSQTIEDGIKFIISKTQENCKLTKVY
jgi:translation elongation factor Ts